MSVGAVSAVQKLIERFQTSLADATFVKLTLSEPCDGESDLSNVYGRMVELRDGRHLQIVYRHARRDITKNLQLGEAPAVIAGLLGSTFARAYLFTTAGDWRWQGPGEGQIKAQRPSFTAAPSREHDRSKVKALIHAPWLTALGVTNADGSARAGMADKLRQVERYAEILGHLIEEGPLRTASAVRMADLGCGKGYLTFAAHEFLRQRGIDVRTTGVEQRGELVDLTNRVARENGCSGLEFIAGDINSYQPAESLDILIALHACDTATDDALNLGLKANASLLVAAPCCHREIRPQIGSAGVLAPVLRHGILAEREAEIVTDAIRALLLEIHGCKARVFEFISPEHTSKNVMIAAHRQTSAPDASAKRAQLRELLAFHGIREQRLARLLGELDSMA
jgi:SAM-dependent methyltransferase